MTTADQLLTALDADVDAGVLQWKRQQETEASYWLGKLNDPDLADLDLVEFVDHGRDGVWERALVDGHTSGAEYGVVGVSRYKGFTPIERNLQKALPARPREYRCMPPTGRW